LPFRAWTHNLAADGVVDVDDYGDLPKDVVAVWRINSLSDHEYWIVQSEASGHWLHVMNNEEVHFKGDFRQALVKWFGLQTKIVIREYTSVAKDTLINA
jgi:hypothetical protein